MLCPHHSHMILIEYIRLPAKVLRIGCVSVATHRCLRELTRAY
jgi:hypothetical protein